jgi:uncharacterized protein YndB with AHSA1/START domain
MDTDGEIKAIERTVGTRDTRAGEARTAHLRRTYDAPIEDVWDAITDPERLSRWFTTVSGDLRPGGRYQVQGNAGGEILRCEPPRLLRLTWIFGEPAEDSFSELEVRLSEAAGGGTVVELAHVATVDGDRWTEFGPGAVGVGWDLALMGLALHLETGAPVDPATAITFPTSPEGIAFVRQSATGWADAAVRDGDEAGPAREAAARTVTFYTVPPADQQ